MCGIAGVVGQRADEGTLRAMADALRHRGPDDQGFWIEEQSRVGLAHRRLAIVDLSACGHQPMHSADGRWVLSYNGEIYNHAELRRRLEAQGQAPEGGWRGRSDTETLLQAIACWGLEAALAEAVGMFAFALWDRRERRLHLVRDRFGEKPLYYGWAGRDLVFASELKALRAHPDFRGEIDRVALGHFAARTYIPAPRSIYPGIFKLLPGCILTIDPAVAMPLSAPPEVGGAYRGVSLRRYWSYREVVERGGRDPIGDEREAMEAAEAALSAAVAGQSMADVPVGAFLSGGIDSSTVVALYQRQASSPARTFSIGFEEEGYNEADHARAVAQHLGTVHHEHVVTVREAQDVIPLLPSMYDEPFADSSQIPTFLVSRFARGEVTVALTGDGGDELFAGYNRHVMAPALWEKLSRVPTPLRTVAGRALGRVSSRFWSEALRMLPGHQPPHAGARLQKGLRVAAEARSAGDVFASFLDEWSTERSPVIGGEGAPVPDLAVDAGEVERMCFADAVGYLPDDILCKVDRASMAVSLETRVPFLDHRVAEVAARVPASMKVRDGRGKHILREILYRHVPRELIDRPKSGFAVPVGQWIKGPLRDWAEDLLDASRLSEEGHFDAAAIRRRWTQHLSGQSESTPALWAVLMFQAWLREQRG